MDFFYCKLSQAYSIFSNFVITLRHNIKYFQCDNDKEYDNSSFNKFC